LTSQYSGTGTGGGNADFVVGGTTGSSPGFPGPVGGGITGGTGTVAPGPVGGGVGPVGGTAPW
jgi:hypothetical protein